MSATVIDNELLEAAVSAMPSDALTPIRERAAEQFIEEGFPTTRHEDWKYTNLGDVAELSNTWLAAAANDQATGVLSEAAQQFRDRLAANVDADWLVIDGRLAAAAALPGQDGVDVSKLTDGLPASGLRAEGPMTRFNAALLRDGLRISIAKDAIVKRPIGLLVIDESGQTPGVSQHRVLLDIGENARAQIVQAFWSPAESAHFTNTVSDIDVREGASVDWLHLQECGEHHKLVNTLSVRLQADAHFNHNAFDFGGLLARNDVAVDISGPGAEVGLHGLYLASEHQHIDNHTRVDHKVGPARSNEVYRGILGKKSRCVFNGKAVVHTGADGTDANQANYNLLLSRQAEIDTKPELEIYADDVKCAHGATVGELDTAALYYLQTRGLSRDEAAMLLTRAFAASVLSDLSVEACREYVTLRIDERLNKIISDSGEDAD